MIISTRAANRSGVGFLVAIVVLVISTFDTADGVTKYPLGDVGTDTGAHHQSFGRTPQIVVHPMRYDKFLIQITLVWTPAL